MTTTPKTIAAWLKSRDKFIASGSVGEFLHGVRMPVIGNTAHLLPKGKGHLFSIISYWENKITDKNHESYYKGGRWKTLSSAKHYLYVVSIAVFHKNKLEWLKGPSDVVIKYILPKNWRWERDGLGIKLIDDMGIDFHPNWRNNPTIEEILSQHAQNKEFRKEAINKQKEKENFKRLFNENLNNTKVLLEDSVRAGNCLEGSLAFAEQKLSLIREDVLNGKYLIGVLAAKLLKTNDERAARAAFIAFQRETIISI